MHLHILSLIIIIKQTCCKGYNIKEDICYQGHDDTGEDKQAGPQVGYQDQSDHEHTGRRQSQVTEQFILDHLQRVIKVLKYWRLLLGFIIGLKKKKINDNYESSGFPNETSKL